eukprot:SAG31_NODE_1735_length_7410_cov_2.762960_7_plen_271_part_00
MSAQSTAGAGSASPQGLQLQAQRLHKLAAAVASDVSGHVDSDGIDLHTRNNNGNGESDPDAGSGAMMHSGSANALPPAALSRPSHLGQHNDAPQKVPAVESCIVNPDHTFSAAMLLAAGDEGGSEVAAAAAAAAATATADAFAAAMHRQGFAVVRFDAGSTGGLHLHLHLGGQNWMTAMHDFEPAATPVATAAAAEILDQLGRRCLEVLEARTPPSKRSRCIWPSESFERGRSIEGRLSSLLPSRNQGRELRLSCCGGGKELLSRFCAHY